MTSRFLALVTLIVAFAPGTPAAAAEGCPATGMVEVTYVANEGFLLAAGNQKILIDSLHRGGIVGYAVPAGETLEELETATGPYTGVDVVLVSHRHADHFHPASVARHLRNNPSAWLISSPEIIQAVSSEPGWDATAAGRMQAFYPDRAARSMIEKAGIRMEIIRLEHANVQNLGHLLTLGGARILHIGDAEMTEENFAPLRLPQDQIDIAFLPYWYLITTAGRELIGKHIRPKCVVAMHMEPAQVQEITKEIEEEFPGAVIFARPLEKKTF